MSDMLFVVDALGVYTWIFLAGSFLFGVLWASAQWAPEASVRSALLRQRDKLLERLGKSGAIPESFRKKPAWLAIVGPAGDPESGGKPSLLSALLSDRPRTGTDEQAKPKSAATGKKPGKRADKRTVRAQQQPDARTRRREPRSASESATLKRPGQHRDPTLGLVYREEPAEVDALWMIRGLGHRYLRKLQELGIYQFRQVAEWTPQNLKSVSGCLSAEFQRKVDASGWAVQANELHVLKHGLARIPTRVDHKAIQAKHFAGEKTLYDPDLGVIYAAAPPLAEPLTWIHGIGPIVEEGLNPLGIYSFGQVAHWSMHNIGVIAARIGVDPSRILGDRWVHQARWLHWETYLACPDWTEQDPPMEEWQSKCALEYAGQEAVYADRRFGIRYRERPGVWDELAQIKGLSDAMIDQLHRLGVWRYQQVSDWSLANVNAFANELGVAERLIHLQGWVRQAQPLAELCQERTLFAGESMRSDPRLGFLYYLPPDRPDDLRYLPGLTEDHSAKLNAMGVHTFKQIALWKTETVASFAKQLGVDKSYIITNRWVQHANKLFNRSVLAASRYARRD